MERDPGGSADLSPRRRPSKNYVEKYGPMLSLLKSEDDFDFLASAEGYRPDHARHYRSIRHQALQGYVSELKADFEELFEAALPYALRDVELAQQLANAQRALRRATRHIRIRLLLEALLPTPAASPKPKSYRRWASRLLPESASPRDLLVRMNAIGDRLASSRR